MKLCNCKGIRDTIIGSILCLCLWLSWSSSLELMSDAVVHGAGVLVRSDASSSSQSQLYKSVSPLPHQSFGCIPHTLHCMRLARLNVVGIARQTGWYIGRSTQEGQPDRDQRQDGNPEPPIATQTPNVGQDIGHGRSGLDNFFRGCVGRFDGSNFGFRLVKTRTGTFRPVG